MADGRTDAWQMEARRGHELLQVRCLLAFVVWACEMAPGQKKGFGSLCPLLLSEAPDQLMLIQLAIGPLL